MCKSLCRLRNTMPDENKRSQFGHHISSIPALQRSEQLEGLSRWKPISTENPPVLFSVLEPPIQLCSAEAAEGPADSLSGLASAAAWRKSFNCCWDLCSLCSAWNSWTHTDTTISAGDVKALRFNTFISLLNIRMPLRTQSITNHIMIGN